MKAAKLKNKGYEYFQKKKYDKALKYFKDAVKEDPKDTTIQQKIGDTLLKLGRNEEAVKAYKKAADQYAKKGFLMKAIGVYKLILDIKPEAEDVKDLLAKLYAERQIPEVEATTVSPSAILEIVKKKKEQVKEEEQKSEQIEVEAKEVAESSKKTVEKISALPEEEESEEEGEIEVEIEEGEENIDQFIKELGLDEEVEITLDNKEEYIEKLPTYPIFSRCSEECFKDIIDKINLKTFAPGEVIIKEGEAGKNFYIIVEGKVEVKKTTGQGQILLATLEEGAFFGEFAFLTGARRSASVVAASEVTLLEFTEDILEELLRKHPMIAEVLVEFYRERILDTMLAVSPFFL